MVSLIPLGLHPQKTVNKKKNICLHCFFNQFSTFLYHVCLPRPTTKKQKKNGPRGKQKRYKNGDCNGSGSG